MNKNVIKYCITNAGRTEDMTMVFEIKINTTRELNKEEYWSLFRKIFKKEDLPNLYFRQPEIERNINSYKGYESMADNTKRLDEVTWSYYFRGLFDSFEPFTYNFGTIEDDEFRQDI